MENKSYETTEIREYDKSYQEYKAELDQELNKASESFVKIGYLLKVARDTDILANSPYNNVVDFAKAEYGIDKTQVSRFIHINDKFSEGGYSDHLLPGYRGFGYAKLTLMLQLPDSINEELTPEYSKAEIQSIKDEIDEEAKVTDIERLLEGESSVLGAIDTPLGKTIAQLGEDEPELYVEIAKILHEEYAEVDVINDKRVSSRLVDIMAPAGEKIYSIRVRGTGRMMLVVSDSNDMVRLINSRSGEKLNCDFNQMADCWDALIDYRISPEGAWEKRYGMKFPRRGEIVPVQPAKQGNKKEIKPAKKESKVKKAKPEKAIVSEKKPETVKETIVHKNDIVETEVDESVETIQEVNQEGVKEFRHERISMADVLAEAATLEPVETVEVIENVPKYITRKEYLDNLTAYEASRYICDEFEVSFSSGMFVNPDEVETWLEELVDYSGKKVG